MIARADTLSNDRLAAVKLAIRRDLAEAGIGFGIFDTDPPLHTQDDHAAAASRPDSSNGYGQHGPNGSSSLNNTPPTSPTSPPLLRLPYALISPDMYSHSDGVTRRLPSRHELVQQYTPSTHYAMPSHFPRGKFVRAYRWGTLDVLDPNHSDFVSLRTAIFHHMDVSANLASNFVGSVLIIFFALTLIFDRLYVATLKCTCSKSSARSTAITSALPLAILSLISHTCQLLCLILLDLSWLLTLLLYKLLTDILLLFQSSNSNSSNSNSNFVMCILMCATCLARVPCKSPPRTAAPVELRRVCIRFVNLNSIH